MLARIKARIEELKAAIMIPECIPAKTNQSPCGYHIAQREELAFLEGLEGELEASITTMSRLDAFSYDNWWKAVNWPRGE